MTRAICSSQSIRCGAYGSALIGLLLLQSCVSNTIGAMPLANVDMTRMYGGWYIIATIPNVFEKRMIEPYDVYSLRPDGDIREDFYFRNGEFSASCHHFTVHDWVRTGTRNAVWRVQLIWPFTVPFLVGYVDPDYRFAIFGENSRQLGWIYARSPTMSDGEYSSLLRQVANLGYNPAKFKRFLQEPSQFDSPGFWTDGIKKGSNRTRCAP